MANIKTLSITLVARIKPKDGEEIRWTQVAQPIGKWIDHPYYKDVTVKITDKKGIKIFPIAKACEQHELIAKQIKLLNDPASLMAKQFAEQIKQSLYDQAHKIIDHWYDDPDVLIHSVYRKNPNANENSDLELRTPEEQQAGAVIAFCPLIEGVYKGTVQTVPKVHKEYINTVVRCEKPDGYHQIKMADGTHVRYNLIRCKGVYTEGACITTDSTVQYKGVQTMYTWVLRTLEIANMFGLTANWQISYHRGQRGLCLTHHDAKELQATANWYLGQARKGVDLSDHIELFHINGIDVLTTTRYDYLSNQELYQDWQESEDRDMQAPIYGDTDEASDDNY